MQIKQYRDMEKLWSHYFRKVTILIHSITISDEFQVWEVLVFALERWIHLLILWIKLRIVNMEHKLLTDCFEYGGNNLLNAICKTKQAALHIFVVVSQYFVQLIEELDFLLNYSHPTKVKFEEKQESQDAFSADHYVLMLKKFEKSFQEHLFLEQNGADLWIVNVVERKV